MNRSKRLGLGAAHERLLGPPEGGDDLQERKLIEALALLLLSLDVLPDRPFISTDGRHDLGVVRVYDRLGYRSPASRRSRAQRLSRSFSMAATSAFPRCAKRFCVAR